MNAFRVLTGDESDRSEWLHAWASTGREPFAHPGYLRSFAVDGASARCAVSESGADVAILPFLLRPIRVGAWSPTVAATDATSPYGYGGPYGTPGADFSTLWDGLVDWLQRNGVVSFFGRLALGEQAIRGVPGSAVLASDNDNVVVSLRRSADEQWRSYDHKVRKNVSKAQRSGLTVEVRNSYTDAGEFTSLYHSTMDRRQAAQWYYFDEAFFRGIGTDLPDNHIVAEVRDEHGTLVSGELVLVSDHYCYSYLGGTVADAFAMRPNDLLKHAVIGFGRAAGLRGYVLGGGLSRDDGLFRYKRAFDRTGSVPFYRLNFICDLGAYRAIEAERLSDGCGDGLDPDFFPAYRAPRIEEHERPVSSAEPG